VRQARKVLARTHTLEFKISHEDGQRYAWGESVLGRFGYVRLSRADRGVVLAYVRHLSGDSRAQVTRLGQCQCHKADISRAIKPDISICYRQDKCNHYWRYSIRFTLNSTPRGAPGMLVERQ